jgi:uroporphyrinogen decarboxylase
MTKKQRILAAIQHKPVDRLPTTFRANKYLAELLMRRFGLEDPKDFGRNQKPFLDRLKADFWSSGTKLDKFSTFSPRYAGPLPQPPYVDDGTSFYKIGIHSRPARMPGYDIEYPLIGVDPPLAAASSPSDIPQGYLLDRLELFDFERMSNAYREVKPEQIRHSEEDLVSLGTLSSPFMICCYLRGMEAFLMDMSFNRKLAERITGAVSDFVLEFNRRELAAMRGMAAYYGTWDDVAGQDAMLFSPALFQRYFLPTYRKLIDNAHAHGLYYGWHCCGSIHEALPLMIEAGIDVFDVVQTSARGMELGHLRRQYGGDVCFHGTLDVQKDLVEKTAGQVRALVRRVKDLWGLCGGIILAPTHETLPDTPLENLLAIYEEVMEPENPN